MSTGSNHIAENNTVRMAYPAVVLCLACLLTACGHDRVATLEEFAPADMTGYEALTHYGEPLQFVDMTVADVHRLMEERETFVFWASFADCPWCNAVICQINEAALDAGVRVGSIDTRKNPDWISNTDIDDYDLFIEDFGEYLDLDEDDLPHLYAPHIFFVRKGEVCYQYQGALPEMDDDPYMELTDAENKELTDIFRAGFAKLQSR